jgi:hypothetical protein
MLLKVGPFYGPVKKACKQYFFHELCVIWSPKVYLDDNDKLKNVQSEITRGRKTYCYYCGMLGATIGCYIKACKNIYHYLCAKSLGCFLNDQDYIIFCPDHLHKSNCKDLIIPAPKKNFESNIDNLSNMVCMICKSGQDEAKILLCDKCDCGVHTYCNEPEILEPPESIDTYICPDCSS